MVMKKLIKILIILFIVIIGVVGIWLSLDKTTKCYLIYGKNICNFYAMLDIASSNPSISDFDRMMDLCSDMRDVPKKDGCFEVVALTFARIDMDKAKEACNEIKETRDQTGNMVHTREACYGKIEKP